MKLLIILIIITLLNSSQMNSVSAATIPSHSLRFWDVQSIDTMKFSRDIARQKLNDPAYDADIEIQVRHIAETGATHIGISTPFDEEFIPYLKRWVTAARNHNLNVWFRGNFAGWEQWFEYPEISREEHISMTRDFILNNPDLFKDGDIFVSCPECENGGPGDPRETGDVDGFKNFLITEYSVVNESFEAIDKDIITNYYSMNGDVAKLIMDERTTKALGGVVTIDHYVLSNDTFVKDIKNYAKTSKGSVVLGEWGAPIPDIHGEFTEEEQSKYLDEGFKKLLELPEVTGINYWTHIDSSTEIWNKDYKPKNAVSILTNYFKPKVITGTVSDSRGHPLDGAIVKSPYRSVITRNGTYSIPILKNEALTIEKDGYRTLKLNISTNEIGLEKNIALTKLESSFMDKILDYFYILFNGKVLTSAKIST